LIVFGSYTVLMGGGARSRFGFDLEVIFPSLYVKADSGELL